MKLSEALTKYIAFGQYKNKSSSMATYQIHIKHLVLYFRNCQIEEIKLEDIINYMEAMRELGWDLNSMVAKASAYKQFFKFFHSQGIVTFNVETIPVPRQQPRFPKIIEEDDYKKLLGAIDHAKVKGVREVRARLICQLLWDTGMRLNELRALNVPDVDTQLMRAIIKTEKARGIKPTRMIFWTEETNETLIKYLKLRQEMIEKVGCEDSGALIATLWGRWTVGARMSEQAIESLMKELSHRANLGYIANPHRFRHRFGRNLALQGANNSVISDMMGHSSMESTRIYTVMNESMMQDAYDRYFKKG